MAFTDVSTEGMNYVTLKQLIDDFVITMDSDDYISRVNDAMLRNVALRGIREFGFDVTSRIKSIKSSVNSNNTISLPSDYVDLVKIGVVGSDGVVYVLNQNKNINYSRKVSETASPVEDMGGPMYIEQNEVENREDDKTSTSGADVLTSEDPFESYVFRNYIYENSLGGLYGIGGGHGLGEYRINLDQNRIEIDTSNDVSEVVIEYIADEARSSNPLIHVYAEEALRAYMYYKLCERKSIVPTNEKMRARSEYYNERRKAKARLGNFSKDEALRTIRKNFKQAPKY
ncbi:MAG: hypothetical protein O3C54_04210 [Proteobacteria bacterium]|nr:hypothetical protein [Pseudomonadota bacterium]